MKIILSVWVLVSVLAQAKSAEFDRFNAYHQRTKQQGLLLADLQDGELHDFSLLESALVADGYQRHEMIAEIQQRFLAVASDCSRNRSASEGGDLAKAILRTMHATLLRGEFQPGLSDVGLTILKGDFNCLTTTILFQALCDELSVQAQAEWKPAHVRCWLPSSEECIETTSSTWQSSNRRMGRSLTVPELLGKVFYNRGVNLMHENEYAAALVTIWTSCCLDAHDDQARNNLRACLNNWALDCAQRGDIDKAEELLQHGLQIDPNYVPFIHNKRFLQRVAHPKTNATVEFD